MKKLLSIMLAGIFGIALSVGAVNAASDCLNVKFNNGDSVCLGITKNNSKDFQISVDKNNLSNGSTITCYIVLPNSNMYTLKSCKGTFSYAGAGSDDVIISATYVLRNNDFYSKRIPSVEVNFNKGTWGSSSNTSSSSSSSSSDKISLSTNKKSPSTSQYVNLTIETDKKYTGKLTLSAKYRSSSSSSWSSVSNTSSTYFSSYSDEWDDGYYRMTSSDKGKTTISNLLKFKKNGYYRIYVKDTDGNDSYIEFNVGVSSSSSSSDDIEVKASPSSPDTYEWVKLTITTDDDYTGKINFSKFQYKSSSSSSRSTISSRTSSTYVSDYSSDWSNGYYRMTSSDKGEVTLKNLVKFKKSGYYRIYVEDTDGNDAYVQINVDTSSSSSSSSDDIEVKASPSSPDTYEWVKLTISTDDDYTGKINFSKLQYKSSSSSSWSTISNTSSTYVSDYSSDWSNGYYRMTSSDDGEVTLKNLVKFKKSGYYRIYVEDTDGNESYVQINVDTSSSSSSSSDDIELSTNRKSPSTNQYVNLTIETDRDYVGKLTLSAKYRSSSSSSRSTISNTSSTYFSNYSDEWENGFYRMVSSDKGEYTIDNLLKFKKSGYYRIYVEDYDGNESYIEFNVDTSSSSSSNDDIEVKASPSSPDTYEWVKLTISTDDDYTGKINFSKFQYKSSSSSSWSTISSRTSSTYVSDYSSDWSNGYYRMTSSDDGEVTLKNLVKFKKSGYYRIYVEDTDGNDAYVQINVDTSSSSSSSSDDIELSTNRKSPSTSQYVNLTIETDSKYTGKLTLSAKYRSSSSSTWSSVSNTSSTYFSSYSDEWEDGYYKMKSSDKGEITLSNLVKFKKNGYYRIYVEDTDGNESYIQFNVGNVDDDDDESDVSGFTTSQLSKVKSVYKEWNSMIAQMERKYPSLKRDTYWEKLSSNFYDDMKDVINNKKSRDFDDYEDFQDAFDDWYKYTMRNI